MTDSAVAQEARPPFYKVEPFPTLGFLAKLAVLVLLFRSLVTAPYVIPSESMFPRLMVGDYLLIAKWPYGWTRYSFPGGIPPFDGRIAAANPERGDIVVFRSTVDDDRDFVKRVIGLPGDTVQMVDGGVVLNGVALARQRIADLVIEETPNQLCQGRGALADARRDTLSDGTRVCRYVRYRETLPSGRYYDVLDLERTMADDTDPVAVAPGHLFVLGDNRDRSGDSRVPAAEGGVGLVPLDHLEGRAGIIFFSDSGKASSLNPSTWFSGVRWSRVGEAF
jgi:signal peptidase I